MVKGMRRKDVERALADAGCKVIRTDGGHDIYGCPCGKHIYPLPRHRDISPGVVRKASQMLACLEKGWL